mmetsp:Transcript_21209/g.63833  ORF Transcript_21209/g.63833 Transcript_21209/m.63833 type:complete len:293 (+) Transcript_21209:2460-3338(+)
MSRQSLALAALPTPNILLHDRQLWLPRLPLDLDSGGGKLSLRHLALAALAGLGEPTLERVPCPNNALLLLEGSAATQVGILLNGRDRGVAKVRRQAAQMGWGSRAGQLLVVPQQGQVPRVCLEVGTQPLTVQQLQPQLFRARLFDYSLGKAAGNVFATVSERLNGGGGEPCERLQRRLKAAAVPPVCWGIVGSSGGTLDCRSGVRQCRGKLCGEGSVHRAQQRHGGAWSARAPCAAHPVHVRFHGGGRVYIHHRAHALEVNTPGDAKLLVFPPRRARRLALLAAPPAQACRW